MPAKVNVRPGNEGTQKFTDGTRRKLAPFEPEFVFVPARHVRLDNGGLVLRPQRQIDGDLDAGQDPRLEVRFDPRSAHAEIREPAFPHREPMGHYPDREINLHALAPPMFHVDNNSIGGNVAPSDKHRNDLRKFLHALSCYGDSACN